MVSSRWHVLIALALGLAACSGAPEPETPAADAGERDFWDAMVALTQAFEKDPGARVSVAAERIPRDMAENLDADDDGAVSQEEFWAYREERARRPYTGPSDLSAMSVDREGGFPLNVDPEIVSADAVELGAGDMVVGVVIAGEARAYPVNYMNGPLNEVVNDTLGGAHISPSW